MNFVEKCILVGFALAINSWATSAPLTSTTDDAVPENVLNCATVMFSQPSVKFMHKLRPSDPSALLSVKDLPEGLRWNSRRNLVEGSIDKEGEYGYTIVVVHDSDTVEVPVSLTVSSALQQPVPFMGWLSWNVVQSEISSEVVRTVADAMVESGLADAGYKYLVIDDLWHAPVRELITGKPLPDAAKFPEGMGACADYVHSRGLKFGIYSDAAEETCAKAYGSYGFENIDADQYADWGVDLLKYDY